MQVAVAQSIDPITGHALDECLATLDHDLDGATPALLLVFASMTSEHDVLLKRLADRFPGVPLIGCSTDGEIGPMDFQEDSIVVAAFAGEGLRARVGVGTGLSHDTDAAVAAAVEMVGGAGEADLCLMFTECLTTSGVTVVDTLVRALPGLPIAGGAAADQWTFVETFQFAGGERHTDAVVIALLEGVQTAVGVASGWRPLGPQVLVTRAEANVVHAIDGKPAVEFFHRVHGSYVQPNPAYPLGVYDGDGDSFYLRAPVTFDAATGSVTFAGDVPVGARVQMTEGARTDIIEGCAESTRDAVAKFDGPPSAILVFSCAARKEVLGTRTAQEVEVVRRSLGDAIPVLGFYSYGEVAPDAGRTQVFFHNETFVTLAIGPA